MLVAVLGVEDAWNVIQPRPHVQTAAVAADALAQTGGDRRAEQIDVVVADDEVDGHARVEASSQGRDDRHVGGEHGIEAGQAGRLVPPGRPEQLEDVAEEHDPQTAGVAGGEVVEEVGQCTGAATPIGLGVEVRVGTDDPPPAGGREEAHVNSSARRGASKRKATAMATSGGPMTR